MSKFREICRILLKTNEKKEKCGSPSRFNNSHRRVSWRCGRALLTICPYFVHILFIIHKKLILFSHFLTKNSQIPVDLFTISSFRSKIMNKSIKICE